MQRNNLKLKHFKERALPLKTNVCEDFSTKEKNLPKACSMPKNTPKNNFLNKKSKGQHILELALMMPFFIIIFGYAFQIMVETYAKYKFSYIFTNAVRVIIQKQPIYKNISEAAGYSVREKTEEIVKAAFESGADSPFVNVEVGTISTDKTVYLIGAFQYITKMLFFGDSGKEYFYFIVPVNKTFTTPLVLNNSQSDINSYFSKYYSMYGPRRVEENSASTDSSITGVLD